MVTDCDELTRADVDTILRGGGRHVPTSFPDHPTNGFVVFVGRAEPAIVFIDPLRYPLRVPLSARYAHLLVNRLRAAVGGDAATSTGPRFDDPDWHGIGVERSEALVHVRFRAFALRRDVTLGQDDAMLFAELLEQIITTR